MGIESDWAKSPGSIMMRSPEGGFPKRLNVRRSVLDGVQEIFSDLRCKPFSSLCASDWLICMTLGGLPGWELGGAFVPKSDKVCRLGDALGRETVRGLVTP